jgi:nucleolar MIF4G domain-containing protein 1
VTTKKKGQKGRREDGPAATDDVDDSEEDDFAGAMSADGPNAGFFEMLRADNLVGAGAKAGAADNDDDDVMIQRMEKLLKLKPGRINKEFEEDGLDLLLDYKSDADAALKKWKSKSRGTTTAEDGLSDSEEGAGSTAIDDVAFAVGNEKDEAEIEAEAEAEAQKAAAVWAAEEAEEEAELTQEGLMGEGMPDEYGGGSGGGDDDDFMIQRMEKLLKLKPGRINKEFEEDGLDFLLDYKSDAQEARENWQKQARSGQGEIDPADYNFSDDEAPEEVSSVMQNTARSSLAKEMDQQEAALKKEKKKGKGKAAALAQAKAAFSSEEEEVEEEEEEEGGEEGEDGDGDGAAAENGDDEVEYEPASYISRADAYGGNTFDADGIKESSNGGVNGGGGGKYIPPSQRLGESSTALRVQRNIKGQLNRLNASNLVPTIRVIEGLFGQNSRNEVSSALTKFVLDACGNRSTTLQHLLMVYSACIASFHHLVGVEVSAHFLEKLVNRFHLCYQEAIAALDGARKDEVMVLDKQCQNLATVLCFLYSFRVVHSEVVADLFGRLTKSFRLLDVELLLVCLEIAAPRLRNDDAAALMGTLDAVAATAATAVNDNGDDDTMGSRMKWVISAIAGVKAKGKSAKQSDEAIRLNKAVRTFVSQRDIGFKEPLRIPWDDLLEAETRGRWWLTGAAWAGRANQVPTVKPASVSGSGGAAAAITDGGGGSVVAVDSELLGIAQKQRMNTDVRREIFMAIMSGEDYLDAFEKVLRLKLKNKQDREVVRIIIDCCLQEKTYNPFYALLAVKLCQHNHNHKVTFQYSIWDKFQQLEEMQVSQCSHLAKLLVHLVTEHSLSLAALKVVEFQSLQPRAVFFFQIFFVMLLTTHNEQTTKKPLKRLSGNVKLTNVKDGILVFLRHYVQEFAVGIGNGGDPECTTLHDRQVLLFGRLKLAKRLLTRAVV